MKESRDSRHPKGRARWWSRHLSSQSAPCPVSLDAIHSFTHPLTHSFISKLFDSCSGSGWALGTPKIEIPVPRCSLSSDRTEGQEGTSVSMFPNPRP